jgi:type II secretory pathway pseudopilin PulG
MRLRLRNRLREEGGYTMIAVIGAISLVSMLAAATLSATNGDINLVQYDLDHRRAHAAAQAGIADYSFHLNNDNSFWARCTEVPSPSGNPSAINQQGSTEKRRSVPGPSGEEYAIELLPASTSLEEKCNPAQAVATMLEQSGVNTGSFRIRSTGYAGEAKASIVATYKRASLLDYIYFTQYETSDPVTYGDEDVIEAAEDECVIYRREGREDVDLPEGEECNKIVFVSGDDIQGPLHTNDDLAICGTPKFGRDPADTVGNPTDVIEVSAPPVGWVSGGCSSPSGASPEFVGPFVTTAPVLKPPSTNASLEKKAATTSTVYSCQTEIKLEGTKFKVTRHTSSNTTTTSTVNFPTSGVVYVKDGSCSGSNWPSCSTAYSPFSVTYPSGSDCGTVLVRGTYSGELTIASQGNILITDDIERTGQGLLGLIANNFVRVSHPCGGGIQDLRIDAAILAIDHSFIVDHYNCGSSMGTLTVNGAISQKFRGPVGTTGGTGYIKNYQYDDRLRYMEPPNFLDPIEPSWHIQRETLDFG